MPHTKRASKRKGRKEAVPAVGVVGVVSLLLADCASAGTTGCAADIPSRDIASPHEIALNEEEIFDVTLASFYVFDRENPSGVQSDHFAAAGTNAPKTNAPGTNVPGTNVPGKPKGCKKGCRGVPESGWKG
jgi:hypothetical protein